MRESKGITNLGRLLRVMTPHLVNKKFVFCTLAEENLKKINLAPLLLFKEEEGITIIVEKEIADSASLSYSEVWALITLSVHSDLSAVGFLAAITKKLAKAGISINVVSAYYHDHLFVPASLAKKAMLKLKELSNGA